jgi:hypothetical protein
MVRAFTLGVAVGATGILFGLIELVRRAAQGRALGNALWPRDDGSDQAFGSVWDHGA